LSLLHEYLSDAHRETLSLGDFVARAETHLGMVETRSVATHLAELWTLFAPDFRDRLPEVYSALELPHLLRYIDYTCDEAVIQDNYLGPYEYAADRLTSLRVLEIGGGIPHGLIRLQRERPGSIASAAMNDIDAIYTHFAVWFCDRERISSEWLPAVAGKATELPAQRFNFVFAKDVLEHVHDPDLLLRAIVGAATDDAVLALDLGDKGPRVHQHVSPDLADLEVLLAQQGWTAAVRRGSMTMLERR
jgi:SAM-dependent methyltransferase